LAHRRSRPKALAAAALAERADGNKAVEKRSQGKAGPAEASSAMRSLPRAGVAGLRGLADPTLPVAGVTSPGRRRLNILLRRAVRQPSGNCVGGTCVATSPRLPFLAL
jgi:hypothetical protein